MSSTIKVNNISNLAGDNSGIDLSTNDQIILKTNGTSAVTVNSSQATALGGNLTIPNGGLIGSAGDADAISIATNGVVTFSQTPVGTGGGLVKLAKTTITSATGLVAFNSSIITSAYDNYYITLQNVVPSANNTDLRARCSIDNGSNFITHECSLSYVQCNGSDTGRVYSNRTSIGITEDEHNGSAKGINGTITLLGVNGSTTKDALSYGFASNGGTPTNQYAYEGKTAIDTASVLNYIKIFGDQTIASGIFTIYGIAK